MKEFLGGVDPGAIVRVLDKKTKSAKKKRLRDLKPGDWLGQAASEYYFAVNEVRIFKREIRGFKLKLESGERLAVAENTVLCGQYGGNLLEDVEGALLCFANMGHFYDSEDSRRTFRIEFKAPDKYARQLKNICRHSSSHPLHGTYEKKFYGYSDVMRFLRELGARLPDARVILGLQVDVHHNTELYDICRAKEKRHIFMPLFPITDLYTDRGRSYPALTALYDGAYRTECRKVQSCVEFTSDGPWAFPVFDDHDDPSTPSHHRFSFTANGIPIFYPNQFIDEKAVELTLPQKGQPQLPIEPSEEEKRKRIPSCYDLASVYDRLLDLAAEEHADIPGGASEEEAASLFEILRSLAARKTDRHALAGALEKKVIALHHAKFGIGQESGKPAIDGPGTS